jgi:hypothetical protein
MKQKRAEEGRREQRQIVIVIDIVADLCNRCLT